MTKIDARLERGPSEVERSGMISRKLDKKGRDSQFKADLYDLCRRRHEKREGVTRSRHCTGQPLKRDP